MGIAASMDQRPRPMGRPPLSLTARRGDHAGMTSSLDVLVIESYPHVADDARAAVQAAGHRVHSCYDPGSEGFPCKALLEPDGCPLDQGMDVALLVRHRILLQPTTLENGAICAIRAGVPVAEQGSPILDPFEPWITSRVGVRGDPVQACEAAVSSALEPLRREIMVRATRLLEAAGKPASELACRIERQGQRLAVRLGGPEIGTILRQALALQVMSAVQITRQAADPLDVSYEILRKA